MGSQTMATMHQRNEQILEMRAKGVPRQEVRIQSPVSTQRVVVN